jgi:hypothetical protein
MIKMTKTRVSKHARKGTKGVKSHSRSRSTKKKKVDPFAGTALAGARHVKTLSREFPMGKEPIKAIWNSKLGIANITKLTQEDIFSGETYVEYIVAFREHGVKFTDPLSKRMGREFVKPFKRKDKAIKFYKSLKVD